MKVRHSRVDQLCIGYVAEWGYRFTQALGRNGARASSLTSATCSPKVIKFALREFRRTMPCVIG